MLLPRPAYKYAYLEMRLLYTQLMHSDIDHKYKKLATMSLHEPIRRCCCSCFFFFFTSLFLPSTSSIYVAMAAASDMRTAETSAVAYWRAHPLPVWGRRKLFAARLRRIPNHMQQQLCSSKTILE